MLDTIRNAWGWIGLDPTDVVAVNAFGNVIARGTDGNYWRICPEEWSCEVVAGNAHQFAKLMNDDEFQTDWTMSPLVELATQQIGPVSDGRCYCLKIPAVIGGKYEADNIGTISLDELISFSGDMAAQIKDLPDCAQIEINFE
jgi:hypothetical protein